MTPAYAIVRRDNFQSPPAVYVKKVVRTLERAEQEVKRLNTLVEGKEIVYSWQYTRIED